MTEHKYTDEQVIKAIEICQKAKCWGDCEDMSCPAASRQGCHFYLRTDEDYEVVIQDEMLKDAIDLINRQKAEISVLTSAVDNSTKEFLKLHDKYQEQKAEIEKRRKVINADLVITRRRSGKSQYANEIIRIKTDLVKAQAIKEFADKLKEKSSSIVASHNGVEIPETRTYQISAPSLDDLVKEFTEEKK